MKKAFALFGLVVFASTCLAVEFRADLRIQTGDALMDLHLSNVNLRSSTPAGIKEVKIELQRDYSVPDKQITFLTKQGYTLAEIEYLALLAKQSGKPINEVAALHSKGAGWGVLAKKLGVKPSDLRKQLVKAPKTPKEAPVKSKGR